MNNATRLQYLKAMGIDVWLEKPAPAAIIAEPINCETAGEPVSERTTTPVDWPFLQTAVSNCRLCGLCETRTQTVFGSGNRQAQWLLIGEAPSQSEEEQGLPFMGNAGLLLTEMLRACGLNRDQVFITNIIKCRPVNDRHPHSDEIAHCRTHLLQQKALIAPKIILAIGRQAAQALLQTDAPLNKLRGTVHDFQGTPLIVVYHPEYLLRFLSEKRKAWQDLQLALQTIKQIKGEVCEHG